MLPILASITTVAYILGGRGDSCSVSCGRIGRSCIPKIETNETLALFKSLGIDCTPQKDGSDSWSKAEHPGYTHGVCVGFNNIPDEARCESYDWATSRVCNCGDDNTKRPHFGTGHSGVKLPGNETAIFEHTVAPNTVGVMSHFWATCTADCIQSSRIRYYIDGETTPSIDYNPLRASGVGFNDTAIAPWGTKWIGSGSKRAYFHNFKIPFTKSIRITIQSDTLRDQGSFYIIVRGVLNAPITISGVPLPSNAKLLLQKFEGTVQPLEWVNVTDVPTGSGLHFASSLIVKSGNMNFLEGCYHSYTPYNEVFPGTLLSTGTEDYFDSAWYFDAGEFQMPVSGFTHLNKSSAGVTWSAYRFHEMDPLPFDSGLRVVWRNGDVLDPVTHAKCYNQAGNKAGNPTVSEIISYSWVYVW
eukprot:TRINITY_DN492_c0_g1_i1.p1 TRINITY_DN492_c0_g1~~TRINITY_DN492_c0_g1_i1.p1  ORF type:complete len:414 (+),score=83.54 TRINITY_DN492_c0_g1_i1:65-1306(+)